MAKLISTRELATIITALLVKPELFLQKNIAH